MGEDNARVGLWRTPGVWWLGGLFALMPIVLELVFSRGDPRPAPAYASWLAWSALPLAMLGLALWRNRRAFAAWTWPRRAGSLALFALETLSWCVAFLVPAFFLLPQYASYTPRAQTSELLLAASSARTAVAERAVTAKSLARAGEGVRIPAGGKVTASVVATNGTIAVYREQFGVLAVLFPRIEGVQALWTCDVYPEKLSPSSCRTDSPSPPPTSGQRGVAGTPARHAADLLAIAEKLQEEVATGAKARGTLRDAAKGRVLPPGEVLDFGLVDDDGTIALYSERHGVFLLLEAALKGGALEWRCRAWPREAGSPRCPSPGAA